MPAYKAPVEDALFLLNDVFHIERYANLPGFSEATPDVVITYGRYVARYKNADPGRRQFTVWYERVYAKRAGQWQYLSHRTVHGPVYERD